ncbi:hypothetical protein NM688_g5716 [Phlebia brevispora]|uniref:Uncharacterized protein n=1 Tax=Phlebia brevispora TaxID=194682 RepID=A0ACC1SR02_9APHY|nr:hypothetical protein NM688_g5716 [Phlebia brevispora]
MDVFGIVYIIENAQQFWSELEDILHIPSDLTLQQLDATLRRFVSFCACYHEQFLQDPLQLQHACDLLLASELFTFHSERMCDLLLEDAQTSTDPHYQLILYNILLAYGRRHSTFLRSQKKWEPLIPLLMDHVRLDLDPDMDEVYPGGSSAGVPTATSRGIAVPIEARLRLLSICLLYEVCRVQKLSLHDLHPHPIDDTFNYAVIKLIIALNEQFMVASLQPQTPHVEAKRESKRPEDYNRVLRILMARMGSSMTFGENMIFMLNRAGRSPEDLVMQLLVLKILYLIFTTDGTSEFFYCNDLKVLVDVFLREIADLDEENESVRHFTPLSTCTCLAPRSYDIRIFEYYIPSLARHNSVRCHISGHK